MSFASFGPFLYTSLIATAASLVAGLLVFPHTSSASFARDLVDAIRSSEILLRHIAASHHGKIHSPRGTTPLADLRRTVEALPPAYWEGVYEISYARAGVEGLQPLLGVARRLVSVFSSGMAPRVALDDKEELIAGHVQLSASIAQLVDACSTSLALTRHTISATFLARSRPPDDALAEIKAQRSALRRAESSFRQVVRTTLDLRHLHARLQPHETIDARRPFLRTAFFCTSLLQLAHDAERSLQVAEKLVKERSPRSRVRLPRFDRAALRWRDRSTGIGEIFAPGA
jgi:hypothetical protein